MKKDSFTEDIRTRICTHMNQDHKDALNFYARMYGGIKEPINTEMLDINYEFMTLSVDKNLIEIRFNPPLRSREDAHKRLVEMMKTS